MSGELLVTIVYYLILCSAFACASIPVVFFFLWSFFDFWKKHVITFYVMMTALVAGAFAVVYFTQHFWIYWYYPFPWWAQIFGLLLVIFGYLVIRLSQAAITMPVRLFYPLLKGKAIHLKTTGLYRFVRHPIYAVYPWIIFGSFLYSGQFILIPCFFFALFTRTWFVEKEEIQLRKVIVGDYDKYMKQTPHRFYPYFHKTK